MIINKIISIILISCWVFLYLYWSWYSVTDIKKYGESYYYKVKTYTKIWISWNIAIVVGSLISGSIMLIIELNK